MNKALYRIFVVFAAYLLAAGTACLGRTMPQHPTDSAAVRTRHMPVKQRNMHTADTAARSFAADSTGIPDDIDLILGMAMEADTLPAATKISKYDQWEERTALFNPDPTRAVWMAALFPGLGQLYNRRYWKLPIVIGAYMGLGYATSWNNGMLNDYTKAYRDIMDNDPDTKSYMNFFPPTVTEESLDHSWLTNVLKSRKDFYRRNRDLCIIAMAGVYLLAMVDAYVDASLSHFDITPDLTMNVSPALIIDNPSSKPSVGLVWALNF